MVRGTAEMTEKGQRLPREMWVKGILVLTAALLLGLALGAACGSTPSPAPAYRPGTAFGSLTWFEENRAYLQDLGWENLACARRGAEGVELDRSPHLDDLAAELSAHYREAGQAAAVARAATLGCAVDVRLLPLEREANPIGEVENPCAFLWYAAIPGSPPLPPRDDPSIREVGMVLEHLSLPEGPALLLLLCWQTEVPG